MALVNRLSRYFQAVFYTIAGVNHFVQPEFYYPLIPPYLPEHVLINYGSGVFEIVFGLGLLFKITRNWAKYGIIAMLIAFIPSHIYFIQLGGCVTNVLCVGLWVSWIRLVLVHPLLILWAASIKTSN